MAGCEESETPTTVAVRPKRPGDPKLTPMPGRAPLPVPGHRLPCVSDTVEAVEVGGGPVLSLLLLLSWTPLIVLKKNEGEVSSATTWSWP